MKFIWIVIILIAIGYLGGKLVFSKEKLPKIIRDFFLTGWEFILVGVALGPIGLDFISATRLEQLNPFIALGLGWTGLIFGTQLRRDDLLKVDPAIISLTLFQAAFVGSALFALFFTVLSFHPWFAWSEVITASCVIAAAGAVSSPTALSLMASEIPVTMKSAARTLMIVSTLDVAPILLVIGFLFCFFPATEFGVFSPWHGVLYTFYSIVMALALALMFRFFGREKLSYEEDLTVFIGFLIFVAGIAFYLGLSPLFLSLLTGIVLGNILKPDDRVFTMMYATEKPFYVIMLLLTGILISETSLPVFIAAIVIVAVRLWLKVFSVNKAVKYLGIQNIATKEAGLGLTAQGALSIAIGLNYTLVYPGKEAQVAFTIIIIATVINEIIAPFLIRRSLGRETG